MKVNLLMAKKMEGEKSSIKMEINFKGSGIKGKFTGLEDMLISEMIVFFKVFGVRENIAGKKVIINSSLFNFHDI
jgi:hypothetical protein